MNEIKFAYQEQDKEFEEAIKNCFPNYQYLSSEKGFDGLTLFITIAIPITAVSLQLLDFILTHLAKKDESKSRERPETKRALVTKEGLLFLENYSKNEVKDILEAYLNEQQ